MCSMQQLLSFGVQSLGHTSGSCFSFLLLVVGRCMSLSGSMSACNCYNLLYHFVCPPLPSFFSEDTLIMIPLDVGEKVMMPARIQPASRWKNHLAARGPLGVSGLPSSLLQSIWHCIALDGGWAVTLNMHWMVSNWTAPTSVLSLSLSLRKPLAAIVHVCVSHTTLLLTSVDRSVGQLPI